MSKRTLITTITALPPGVTRETVLETLHTHTEMIDLNPLVQERHPIKPPAKASPEEYHCQWYEITDKVQYLPGGLYSGSVSFNACFHDLADGIQTHVYAPMGLEIRGRWTIGGSLPGEPQAPVEIGKGIPPTGLYLREDSNVKCNILMAGIVKRNLKHSHAALIARIIARAQMQDATQTNVPKREPTPPVDLSSPQTGFAYTSQSLRHSPNGKPNYSPPDQQNNRNLYAVPAPLNVRSTSTTQPPNPYHQQAPVNPYTLDAQAAHSYTQSYAPQYDRRFSSQPQPPVGAYRTPSYTVALDPAFAATASPHWQPQVPQYVAQQAPQELPSQEKKKDPKGGVSPAGPPAHPVAASELPSGFE